MKKGYYDCGLVSPFLLENLPRFQLSRQIEVRIPFISECQERVPRFDILGTRRCVKIAVAIAEMKNHGGSGPAICKKEPGSRAGQSSYAESGNLATVVTAAI